MQAKGWKRLISNCNLQHLGVCRSRPWGAKSWFSIVIYSIWEFSDPSRGVEKSWLSIVIYSIWEFSDPGSGVEQVDGQLKFTAYGSFPTQALGSNKFIFNSGRFSTQTATSNKLIFNCSLQHLGVCRPWKIVIYSIWESSDLGRGFEKVDFQN